MLWTRSLSSEHFSMCIDYIPHCIYGISHSRHISFMYYTRTIRKREGEIDEDEC